MKAQMISAERLHWICSVPLGITICALGIVGNILSIYIWNRVLKKNIRGNSSTATYLMVLGICDTGVLFFFILSESLPSSAPTITTTFEYDAFYSWFSFPMQFVFIVASIWMVVGVTINRWILIAFPLQSKNLYSKRRTYLSISVILLFSFVVNIPHFFNFHPVEVSPKVYKREKTEYGKSKGSVHYEFWCHCIVLVLVPWLTVAILNSLIIRKLTQRTGRLTSDTSRVKSVKQDRKMTVMLLTITFTFLLLLGWQCIVQCFYMLEYGKREDPSAWNQIDKSFAFAKLGVVINSAINSIFYCFSGTVFRKELKESFSIRSSYKSSSFLMDSMTKSPNTQKKNLIDTDPSENDIS